MGHIYREGVFASHPLHILRVTIQPCCIPVTAQRTFKRIHLLCLNSVQPDTLGPW